jgi:hypothetical protein
VIPLAAVLTETPSMKGWRADQILTGPGFSLPTSMSIEARGWQTEFEQISNIPNENRTPEQQARLVELGRTLNRELPKSGETALSREAATLFEEWAISRLKQRTRQKIAKLTSEAERILLFDEQVTE